MSQLSVTSSGILEEGFQEYQVIDNIINTFKFTPEDAKALIQDGAVIRKSVNQEFAEKLADRFSKQGLKVTLKKTSKIEKKKPKQQVDSESLFATKANIEKLITGEFVHNKVSVQYCLSLILTLLVSLVAPIIYLAIILLLIYSGFQYYDFLTNNLLSINSSFLKLVAIVTPYFIITVLILFLLKPLLFTYSDRKEIELHRRDAPELFNLIEVMCEKIAAPFPEKICINTDVNASVSAIDGLSSLNKGQLRLTIGLPFLLGLNVRELSAILAHELGHFSQPTAMKAGYLVYRINYWFDNRAHAPDAWDERLAEWSEQADGHIAIIVSLFLAKQSILLIRLLFSFLYHLNYRLTQYMSRAMEYDADSYASRFVGNETVAHTFAKIKKFDCASCRAEEINFQAWCDEKLLANLPLATIEFAKENNETVAEFKHSIRNSKTSTMDSHPSMNDRIKQLNITPSQGIFSNETDAKSLIKSIDKLCELATIEVYKNEGMHNPTRYVVENKQLIGLDEYKKKAKESFNTFFNEANNGRLLALTPMTNNKPQSHIDCMNAIREQLPTINSIDTSYNQVLHKINNADLFRSYLQAGLEVDPIEFGITEEDSHRLDDFLGGLNYQLVEKKNEFKVMDQLFYERIEFNKQLVSEQEQQTLQSSLNNLQAIQRIEPIIFNLKRYNFMFHYLLSVDDELHDKVMPMIKRFASLAFDDARRVLSHAKNIPLKDNRLTNLALFIESWTGEMPAQKQAYQLDEHFENAEQICKAIYYQYYWHFADISQICCQAERENKITPLSFPPQEC
ncbi:MAG: M48 family metalloprotease [Alteromonadales bacterium]|nr:M48 family metalloprotease [Alteromonadales bacterium]